MKKSLKNIIKYGICSFALVLGLIGSNISTYAAQSSFTKEQLTGTWPGGAEDGNSKIASGVNAINFYSYFSDPDRSAYLKGAKTLNGKYYVFTFDPNVTWDGTDERNNPHRIELFGSKSALSIDLTKNPLISFKKNIDTYWAKDTTVGYHTYVYQTQFNDIIPLAGWVAEYNWKSIHHNNDSTIGTNFTLGEDWETGDKILSTYTYRDDCEKWGTGTSYFPICAYCGSVIQVNFYGSKEAHKNLPVLQQGAKFIYTCRHKENGVLCNGIEQGISISHKLCARNT